MSKYLLRTLFFISLILVGLDAYGQNRTVTYNTPGTGSLTIYNPNPIGTPLNLTAEVWGAGGAGADGNRGGGGGGGGYSSSTFNSLTGYPFNYQIGQGLIGGIGTSTWFINSTTLLANGGSAGTTTAGGAGGLIGIGSNSFIGGNGFKPGSGNVGGGGGSSAGNSSNGSNPTGQAGGVAPTDGGSGGSGGNNGANGSVGNLPGGGGGGGGNGGFGARGGHGQLKLSWNCSNVLVSGNPNPSPICIGTGFGPVVYDLIGASGYTLTWTGTSGPNNPPAGITDSNVDGRITISGVSTVTGTFSYILTPTYPTGSTGTCAGSGSFSGSFTVNPNNTAGTISSSTFCQGSPLPAGVTQSTTGATGIGAITWTPSNPGGITATWASNQITFSGTPSTPGTYNYSIPLTGGCGVVNATGTITINQTPAISAFSAAGGTQCVVAGSTFPAMSVGTGFGYTYQWYSNTVPSTVGGTAIAGAISESYAPSASSVGTLYYYVVVSSPSCTSATSGVSAAYITSPNNTAGPASSSPIACINSAIPTAILHTTTGATGIGAPTGLPLGVTATWASNTITISGTPTQSGVFNYSIPLTGGCGTVNATGTITVNDVPAIISPSLSLSGQRKCLNVAPGFTALSVGTGTGFQYQWYSNTTNSNIGGTAIIGANSNSYTPLNSTAGTLYYYVEVTSSSACVSVAKSGASGAFVVDPLPTVSFVSQPAAGNYCVDTDITYSTQTGETNYTWTIPGTTGVDYTITSGGNGSPNLVLKWLTSGSKYVTVNYQDAQGCGATTPATSNTITIQKNTVTTSSVANPVACFTNRAISFTHTTTLATGITNITGLPLGISATFSGNTITIGGTVDPSVAAGIYNYSIQLTGGCGTVFATGYIDVQPEYLLTKISSISPSTTGGTASITLTGSPTLFANGQYVVTYNMGLANPGTNLSSTVTFTGGVGTFTTPPLANEQLTSLTITSIRKVGESCNVPISANNVTFFGIQPKIFDSNGTFYVPAGIYQITVKVYGGGGGGGKASNGAGGGGGGYSEKTFSVVPGEPIGIFVGAGGAGQTGVAAAGSGGPSYVTRDSSNPSPTTSSLAYAYGGAGANAGTVGAGGVGQTSNGQAGFIPTGLTGGLGGKGGGPDGGNGGPGGTSGNAAANKGKAGSLFGGGGGGGYGNSDGGAGASGYVIITYPLPPVDPCFLVIDDGARSGTTIIQYTCDQSWEAPEGLLEFNVVVGSGGGGGGGGEGSGGGGSGAIIFQTFTTTNPIGLPAGQIYEIEVGQGGPGATGVNLTGFSGEASKFSGTMDGAPINIVVPGGGGGGSRSYNPGGNGASGGGGGASPNNPPSTTGTFGPGGNSIPITYSGTNVLVIQGNVGGNGDYSSSQNSVAGGGGGGLIPWGSGNDGQHGKAAGNGQGEGGKGGNGMVLYMGDSVRYFGAGGGGIGEYFNGTEKIGFGGLAGTVKIGGDGNLSNPTAIGGAGVDKTGSGGGAGYGGGGKGGNGVVYIYYDNFRILPLEYLYFNADYLKDSREGKLTWATAKEWENSHFEIERAINGVKDWSVIDQVQGAGYSDVPVEYSYLDKNLPVTGGNIFYRLKQVDLSGKYSYSVTRAIQVEPIKGASHWLIYPNPTNGREFHLELVLTEHGLEGEVNAMVSTATGQSQFFSETNLETLSDKIGSYLQSKAAGIYILQLTWNGKTESYKIIKN